jgi:hypothetical protein
MCYLANPFVTVAVADNALRNKEVRAGAARTPRCALGCAVPPVRATAAREGQQSTQRVRSCTRVRADARFCTRALHRAQHIKGNWFCDLWNGCVHAHAARRAPAACDSLF